MLKVATACCSYRRLTRVDPLQNHAQMGMRSPALSWRGIKILPLRRPSRHAQFQFARPLAPSESFMRRTRIIATLGPATDSPEMLGRLLDAGLNVARLNMSHAPHDWVRRVIRDLRAAASARNGHVGILIDP